MEIIEVATLLTLIGGAFASGYMIGKDVGRAAANSRPGLKPKRPLSTAKREKWSGPAAATAGTVRV